MNNKTKNNILIISVVTLSALIVITIVLFTGFSKSGQGAGGSVGSVSNIEPVESADASGSSEQSSEESFEPISVPDESTATLSPDDAGQQIAALASSLIGVPFAENGSTPSGFDNSGFIYYVLRENGYITCPRTTDAQSRMGARIERDSLKPGDLVFFGNDGSGEADFGGIYIGNGTMIACLMPGTSVKEIDITNDYYTENFYGGISLS